MLTFLPDALGSGHGGVAAEAGVRRLPAPVSGRALERVSLRADAPCGCGCPVSRAEVHGLFKDDGFDVVKVRLAPSAGVRPQPLTGRQSCSRPPSFPVLENT